MSIHQVTGNPGLQTAIESDPVNIFVTQQSKKLEASGVIVDGILAGDWFNPSLPEVLTAGIVLGKVTATKKYAPTILGILTANSAASATTITVGAAQATEINRRLTANNTVALTGNLTLVSPPTTNGTVAVQTITPSAINVSTGVITVGALADAVVIGGYVAPADGSQAPFGIMGLDYGLRMTDYTGSPTTPHRIDQPLNTLVIAGDVYQSAIIGLNSLEASTLAYFKAQLALNGHEFTYYEDAR